MYHSRPLFLCFHLFNIVESKQMFNIIFANDKIWTTDLWQQRRLLYQLSLSQITSLCREEAKVKKKVVGRNGPFLNWPILASFCLFSFFSHYNFNTNWKKRRWCAWDLNLGPQDGRRKQNHGAMMATHVMAQFLNWMEIEDRKEVMCSKQTCEGNICKKQLKTSATKLGHFW